MLHNIYKEKLDTIVGFYVDHYGFTSLQDFYYFLYYLDFCHMHEKGRPVTYLNYRAYGEGPAPDYDFSEYGGGLIDYDLRVLTPFECSVLVSDYMDNFGYKWDLVWSWVLFMYGEGSVIPYLLAINYESPIDVDDAKECLIGSMEMVDNYGSDSIKKVFVTEEQLKKFNDIKNRIYARLGDDI